MGTRGELAQTGQSRLPGLAEQVADEAGGRTGANFAGRGAFSREEGLIGTAGFVPLSEAQSDIDEEPGAAFGVRELAQLRGLRVVQPGAGVAEHVVGRHSVADHVGGQRPAAARDGRRASRQWLPPR